MSYMQHGDVLVIAIEVVPVGAKPVATRVLAEGEVSGHTHRLLDAADVEVYEHEGTLFLRVGSRGAELTHEEHGIGVIPEGTYQVGRVQEYSHFDEEARAVQD